MKRGRNASGSQRLRVDQHYAISRPVRRCNGAPVVGEREIAEVLTDTDRLCGRNRRERTDSDRSAGIRCNGHLVAVRRNAFGRQLRSFETDLELAGTSGGKIHAIFIRAPWVEEYGPEVEVLASVDGHPVAIRQGRLLAVAFHPELAGETRVHEQLLAMGNGRAG